MLKLSLRYKLGFIFLAFLMLNVSAFAVIQGFLKAQEPDALNINLAGKQRMLSQKMTKEAALIIFESDTPDLRKTLSESAQLFDQTLKGFVSGDVDLGLTPTKSGTILRELDKGQTLWQPFYKQVKILTGNAEKVQKLTAFTYLNSHNMELLQQMNMITGLYEADSRNNTRRLFYVQLGLILANLLLVAAAWSLTETRIVRPIRVLSERTKELADGNLTIEVESPREYDEIGILQESYRTMLDKLQSLVRTIQEDSRLVAQSAGELKTSAGQTSQGAEEIVQTIQELTAGAQKQFVETEAIRGVVEEVGSIVKEAFVMAQELADAADMAQAGAVDGNRLLQDATGKMDRVAEKVKKASEEIQGLEEISHEINNIVSTIADIAGQTNLLALNAAIEAARAGEAGRGFAVVASEVQNLAETSKNATGLIRKLISQVQVRTREAVYSMHDGSQEFSEGHQMIRKAADSLLALQAASENVDGTVQKVQLSIQQVVEKNQSVVVKIRDIGAVAESSAAATKEVAANSEKALDAMDAVSVSAGELSGLSRVLAEQANRFQVAETKAPEF